MRKKQRIQPSLLASWPDHPRAIELAIISKILDHQPSIADAAWQDLTNGKRTDTGAEGMEAMSVVRAAILLKTGDHSYESLHFHLVDSSSYRCFMKLGLDDGAPSVSTLQANIKQLSPQTWETINRALLCFAESNGIDKGRKIRVDTTGVAAAIHRPTDASLMVDLVRVICHSLKKAKPPKSKKVRDRRRVTKKLGLMVSNAKDKKTRAGLYKELLNHSVELYHQVLPIALEMKASLRADLNNLGADLLHWLDLLQTVIEQTRQRVILDRKVKASDKIVSIFEPHADILVKGNRETVFGHKVCLTAGPSSLILDCVIESGNPADSTLVKKAISRQIDIYGRAPRQAAMDGGFASKDNLKLAKGLGVKDVAFHKKRGLKVNDMVKSAWVYKKLRNFRAGIEGLISVLKRSLGLSRCTWRGQTGFKAYVWSSVVAFNLVVLARHCLAGNLRI